MIRAAASTQPLDGFFSMTKKKPVPPRDSWIALPAGQELSIDPKLLQHWNNQTKRFREVRGNFLGACFGIEFQLDSLLAETFFPGLNDPHASPKDQVPLTIESGKALKELFDELILKPGSLAQISFAFKIVLFAKLISDLPTLAAIVPDGLVTKLHKVRRIRNRFAHYPIQFKPDGDPPKQTLSGELACRDKTITLDDEFFAQYSVLFSEVLVGLEQTLEKLRKELNRT